MQHEYKLHFLHSHLDKYLENLGDVSDEQRERFHQAIKMMEKLYQGKLDQHKMEDNYWSLERDYIAVCPCRKCKKRKCLPH